MLNYSINKEEVEPKEQINKEELEPRGPPCTCESEKDPWFSRVEPMGYYCRDCGGLVE